MLDIPAFLHCPGASAHGPATPIPGGGEPPGASCDPGTIFPAVSFSDPQEQRRFLVHQNPAWCSTLPDIVHMCASNTDLQGRYLQT